MPRPFIAMRTANIVVEPKDITEKEHHQPSFYLELFYYRNTKLIKL